MDPELQADPDEQSGFDDGDDFPTAAPEGQRADHQQTDSEDEPEQQPEIEYAQLTKAEVEELRSRAALVEELRATQDKSFGTFGRTIKGLQDTLAQFQAGAQVDISQEDIDALREDFPPMADALAKIKRMRSLPVAGVDPNTLNELVQQRLAPAISAIEQKFEMRLLAKDHPDFQQIDADPEFSQWVGRQPAEFRSALAKASAEYDSSTVSDALTKFKAARKTGALQDSTRKSRVAAAVTPRGSGGTRALVGNDERAGFDAA